jgi:predicted kinase
VPRYTQQESAVVYTEAHRLIERWLSAGQTVVFDATNLRESHRRALYEIAERTGASLCLLWMYCSLPTIARRLSLRQTQRDPSDLSDADWMVYRRLAADAQAPGRPFSVINGELSVEDQVAVVKRLCGPSLVR